MRDQTLDQLIAELADRQYGVVEIRQLYALGASRTQITWRIRTGRLVRLHRGVYAVGHRRLQNRGTWLAAVYAIGPAAALGIVHAAAHWELRPPPGGKVNVLVAVRAHPRRQRAGIRVHSVRDLPPHHVTVHEGIRVTTPARTLADLAEHADRPQLMRALELAEHRGLLDAAAVLEAAAGRTGAPLLAHLLDRPAPHTRSDLEAAFLALLDDHRLPRPQTNVLVHGHLVDCYWPERALVVELDSPYTHGPHAFHRDRRRDAELLARGVATIRITDEQLASEPGWVATTVSARVG